MYVNDKASIRVPMSSDRGGLCHVTISVGYMIWEAKICL